MSLFDYMIYPNGKNPKANNNRRSDKNDSRFLSGEDEFKEEFAEDFSLGRDKPDEFIDSDKENVKQENKESGKSFKEEFSADIMSDVSPFGIQSYSKAGITFEKISETQGKVNYDGLLAKSGAQEIFGVIGFGSNQKWEDITTLSFKKESNGAYMAVVPVEQGKNINIAFKDGAENWDNNSGMNYTFVN